MQTLQELMEYIGNRFVFSTENYPNMPTDPKGKILFAIEHSVFHLNKSVGRIAAQCEKAGHGGELDLSEIKAHTTGLLISVLKLA